jgi:hypothetical protein
MSTPKVELPKLEPIKTDVSKPAVVKFEDKDFKNEENNDDLYLNKSKIRYGWTNPDKLNLLNSFINLASVKKATPFEPNVKFGRPETRYVDPARALAANTEQYNSARQAAAMFAGPQSRYSFNAGQFGKNAADIIGQYGNQNVQLGNVAATQFNDINNKQMMYDAERNKRLYDAGVISEQQYQNAMKQARAGVLQAYTQGQKNAADLYNMSMSQSPYYAIDPRTQTIYFNNGKSYDAFLKQKYGTEKDTTDEEKMKSAGYKTLDDWAKSLGYASYDQLLKAKSANAKAAAGK